MDIFELEPLVSTTRPRLKISGQQLVDVRIDNELVNMLEKLATAPPPEVVIDDPALVEVNRLRTPRGFAMKIRYSDMNYLLTEGLAGTSNMTLISRLETIAKSTPHKPTRAAALVALGYDPTRHDLSIFRDAMQDTNHIVRFGAVEGLAAQDILAAQDVEALDERQAGVDHHRELACEHCQVLHLHLLAQAPYLLRAGLRLYLRRLDPGDDDALTPERGDGRFHGLGDALASDVFTRSGPTGICKCRHAVPQLPTSERLVIESVDH